MAEFCLDCWNRMNGTSYTDADLKVSKGTTLCEGCGQIVQCLETYTPGEKIPRLSVRRWIKVRIRLVKDWYYLKFDK